MAAYKVAFASSEIQYDTRDKANTLLPNPAAKIKTPWEVQQILTLSGGVRTYGKESATLSKSDCKTP
jgi:hypothetical protein